MTLTEFIYNITFIYRIFKNILDKATGIVFFLAAFAAVFILIYEFGFYQTVLSQQHIQKTYYIILKLFLYGNLLRLIFNPAMIRNEKGFWYEVITIVGLLFIVATHHKGEGWMYNINHLLTYILLISLSVIQLSKDIVGTLQRHLKPEMMFICSFLFIILTGALLLMLPTAHFGELTFIDALFTATSAVCVTGLTVVNTDSAFTGTGLIILITLIQVGGIGVMTFTSFFAMSFSSQTSFQDQMALKDILNQDSLNHIFRTLAYILLTTVIVESIGTYLIYRQIEDVPAIQDKFFFSSFHAISAFCNAGFSTLPDNLFNPVVRHLYGLQSWLALLVILGGIGFPIVFNYGKWLKHKIYSLISKITRLPRRYKLQPRIVSTTTRIVIPTTIVLIIAGTALFWVFENDNTLKGLPVIGKLATSFMGAVTPRTAGFNNISMSAMLPTTIFLTMILMWIGASPMSTGGGVKTTTLIVALKGIYNTARRKERVELAKRQLSVSNVNRAFVIILLSILWILTATMILVVVEKDISVTKAAFEVISAIGTVGLTLGITPELTVIGKIIISITMFVGRVGLITILFGIIKQQTEKTYIYADDTVIL